MENVCIKGIQTLKTRSCTELCLFVFHSANTVHTKHTKTQIDIGKIRKC